MTCLWFVQRSTGIAAIVDLGWSICMLLACVVYCLYLDGSYLRRGLLAVTAGFWAVRLAGHIYADRIRPGVEDGRYVYLKEHWGHRANARLFWFFQAQALAALVMSLPWFLIAQSSISELRAIDIVGLVLFFVSVWGETTADRQLAIFRRDPGSRGKTCRIGLWRYSRHPNYFFEWLHWWAYVCFAYGSSLWWLVILSPIGVYILLTRFTGIPYTEMQALRSRGDDYRQYQQSTNAFFPWRPRAN